MPVETEKTRSSTPLLWMLVVVVVVIAAVVAALATSGGGDQATGTNNTSNTGDVTPSGPVEVADPADVTVAGVALPPFAPGSDPAIGMTVPALSAPDLDGVASSYSPGDGPAVIAVVAHWCPHCQVEVPFLSEVYGRGGWAEGVRLLVVSTAQDRTLGNWPPSEWLTGVGFAASDVLVDDSATLAGALGTTSFPYLLGVDGSGALRWRRSGSSSAAELRTLTAALTEEPTTVSVGDPEES